MVEESTAAEFPSHRLKCSVVLCTYNGVRHLDEQLASLKRQERPPDEIVISDDQSTDGTWELAQRLQGALGVPTIIRRTPRNVGFVENFSQAIGCATGDILFLCDQDDAWLPTKIAAYERVFIDNRKVGLVFSDAELVDDSGHSLGGTIWATDIVNFTPAEQRAWRSEPGAAIERLIRRSTVTGSTVAFRSEYRPLVLPMPCWTDHAVPHDAWIACLITAVAPTVPLPEPHSLYRLHSGQQLGLDPPETTPRGEHDHVLAQQRSQLLLVAERLESQRDEFQQVDHGLDIVNDKIAHLTTRLALEGSVLRRIGPVWREFRNGRYGRYSTGYLSAVADLLPWTRELKAPRSTADKPS